MLRLHKMVIISVVAIAMNGCAKDLPAVVQPNGVGVLITNGLEEEREKLASQFCFKSFGSFYVSQLSREGPYASMPNYSSYMCNVRPQKEVTGLQLKSLQMRAFKTSAGALTKGIIEHGLDRSGSCTTQDEISHLKKGMGSESGFRLVCNIGRSWYQHHIDEKNGKAYLRTRLSMPNGQQYSYVMSVTGVQITESEPYQKFFKEVADQLFIEAIELTPAEMR